MTIRPISGHLTHLARHSDDCHGGTVTPDCQTCRLLAQACGLDLTPVTVTL